MKFTRTLALGACLPLLALASAARAESEPGPYMAVEAGMTFAGTQNLVARYDVAAAVIPAPVSRIDIRTKNAIDVAVQGGYDFGPVRAELEYSWRRAGIDSVNATAPLVTRFNPAPAAPTTATGAFPDASGRVRTEAIMANLIGDLPLGGIELFAGGGVGYANVRVAKLKATPTATAYAIDDGDSGFAWQLMGGARVPLGDNVSVSLKYNYLRATGIELVDSLKRRVDAGRDHHAVRAGLSFAF